MKFVFASYIKTDQFDNPDDWLKRIAIYSGVLSALAKDHQVISIEQINYQGEVVKHSVNYKFIRFTKWELTFPFKLHHTIRQLKPDVVFIHGLHFPLQVMQLRLFLGKRVKIIVQHHAERPFTGIKKYLQRVAVPFVDAYLFASREMGFDWIKRGNLASPEKIHEVMEVSSVFYKIARDLGIAKTGVTGKVFLYVGRLIALKDPLTIVKSFLKFAVMSPDARLYMIYQTNDLLPQITALLKDHPQSASIVLVGKVPHNDLLYWYNSADFILSASYYEGSGTTVCEAMSCGCVPVLSDIFSFRMMSNNGRCGFLFEAGNESALLLALAQTQQADLEKMKHAASDFFLSHLSFEAIANRIATISSTI
ncbi:glycosyltransferase family 4 protein [Mucilaginibacter calamicampi]|uniref:Glycosyltransferase family 4 protein n=1 Tax=Mucilaginibacter calamicampi TaxID=1302352 RepID=A0ABW2YWW7_9SPHI